MIPGQCCESCRFFSALANECRVRPPSPVVGNTPAGQIILGIFPATKKENWCGEWKPQNEVSLT